MSAQNMTEADQMTLWHNLASGAESGMDFSSRWFQDPMNISTIQTTSIVPAELNAYLYQMENNIADFADMMGNGSVASNFRGYASARKTAMNTLMYNATEGNPCTFYLLLCSLFCCDSRIFFFGCSSRNLFFCYDRRIYLFRFLFLSHQLHQPLHYLVGIHC